MKITKTSVIIFSLTFIVGCIAAIAYFSFVRTRQFVTPQTAVNVSNPPVSQIEPAAEIQTIVENEDWENEDESQFKIKLLETGEGFHGHEIKAKSGETWLGLFKDGDVFSLRTAKIKIERVYDRVIDGDTQKTGKSVSVTGKNQPIFLLKNAKMLREGQVVTLFQNNTYEGEGDSVSFIRGFHQEYQLNDVKYTLRTVEGKNKKGERKLSLLWESEGVSQTLHTTNNFERGSYAGVLYWVGDLDRDGKLDLFTELYIHDNFINQNLFLSSAAEKGKLVRKVARFTTSGC